MVDLLMTQAPLCERGRVGGGASERQNKAESVNELWLGCQLFVGGV
jgi:hypothetical protein